MGLKRSMRRLIVRVIARTYFQPVFEKLRLLSLAGMNIGTGSDVETSGEKRGIALLNKTFAADEALVIFDVGANVGHFARAVGQALKHQHKIYCFEPSTVAFESLQEALGGDANIQINKIGFSDRSEIRTLFADKAGSGIASVYDRGFADHGVAMPLTERVTMQTLDEFCSANNIGHIHYLKLDVEGHELNVLNGGNHMLSSNAIDFIQFEFGGCNLDSRTFFRDFYDRLNPHFKIYRFLQDGLARIREYRELDEVFVTTNFLAIANHLDG